jgi:hypothetical protein
MGRVMTATFGGGEGPSLGYINREQLADTKVDPVFNNYGGADRFWLGPEGGQFSIFFAKGKPQDLDHWVVPKGIDVGAMVATSQSDQHVSMQRDIALVNYSGTKSSLLAQRTIKLLSKSQTASELGVDLGAAKFVGYESVNKITNTGPKALDKKTGTVSIWILGMFVPSSDTVVIAPYDKKGSGPIVNDTYFGKVPADRLKILEDAGVVLFKTDGKYRSKIGLPPGRAKDVIGSIDFANNILTVCTFTLPPGATDYVNSMWTPKQEKPFSGDVSNSYNDDGNLGGFYELETSSPAAFLKPNGSLTHTHRTVHIQGPMETLEAAAQKVFGVKLAEVKKAIP